MAKITPTGEVKLAVPAAQDEVNPYLTEEGDVCVLHSIFCTLRDLFSNKSGLKSQHFTLGAEVISEVKGGDYE